MKRLVHSCVATTLLVAATSNALAQRRDFNTVRKSITTMLESTVREHKIPAMTAAVVFPTTAVQEFGLGYADFDSRRAIKTNDRLLAGSVGKTFFAAIALQLCEQGKLRLNEKISTYVGSEPWFSRLPNAKDLTLRHLLQHTSGIPDHVYDPGFAMAIKNDPMKAYAHHELLQWTLDKKPLHAAGSKFAYADTNYIVLGLVIEKVTGRKAYDLIQERIFRRFGIKDTVPSDNPKIARLVTGTHMQPSPMGLPAQMVKDGQLAFNPQIEWAGGGFASTSLDLARWFDHLGRNHVFAKATWIEAIKGIPMNRAGDVAYGLGFMIRTTKFGEAIGHDGWFPGYLTSVAYFPKENTTVAVMVASDDARSMKMGSWDLLMLVAEEAIPKRK